MTTTLLKRNPLLDNLNLINFSLSLLIVFHHAFTVNIDYNGSFSPKSYGFTISLQRMLYNFSECAVPMFYFLSAYLFYRSFDGSLKQYKEKIYRRFYSLLVPYVIFCTFGFIKHLTVAGAVSGGGNLFLSYLNSLWVCNTMPLWFIRELIALSLLAPVFYRILQSKLLLVVICVLVVFFVSIGIVPYRSFIYWIPVYLMGAKLNNLKLNSIYCMIENHSNLIFLGLLIIYIVWAWFLPNGIFRHDMAWYQNLDFVLFRIFTPIVFLPLMCYVTRKNMKKKEWMNYSFFVYCMHFPVITILRLIMDRVHGFSCNLDLVKYFLIVFLSYSICVIMGMTIRRYLPSVWFVINGHRK